ncbi:MAG: hypothetical protein AB1403_18660, partial [Candidatus Riflebacteria bacterium]
SAEAYSDSWGTFYSAFVPIFDSKKNFVGTLGADLRINDMLARCKPIEDATKRAFFVSCALSLLFGTLIWFTRRFSMQLNASRFQLLESFLLARDFADQSSIRIGKQLNKTAILMVNIAERLDRLALSPQEELSRLIKFERDRLTSLSDKIHTVAELKCGSNKLELGSLKISEIYKNLLTGSWIKDGDSERLTQNSDEKIPESLFGPRHTYEELLQQMLSFFLKMFKGKIECRSVLVQEGTREVVVRQQMIADVSGVDPTGMDLLRVLCDRGKVNDFFFEVELAEAAAIPIARELIYLLNSDINISLENDRFQISFDSIFQKPPEAEEEQEE